MACQDQVERCFPRSSVSLHTVKISKKLQVLVTVRLVVRPVVSEPRHNHPTEPLGRPACLRVVGCLEIVFGAQYAACKVEELGSELLSVVGRMYWGALRIDSVFQECSGHCSCRSISKRKLSPHSAKLVGHDSNEDSSSRGFVIMAE